MTTLYEKYGRRYIPVYDGEIYNYDLMKVGTFRLTYAYLNGGRRYSYDVAPDTAGFCAAMQIAAVAMEAKIAELLKEKPFVRRPYTKKEQALLKEFEERARDIGLFWPTAWIHHAARDIAEAGLQAVREYRP